MDAQAPQETVFEREEVEHELVVPVCQKTDGGSRNGIHDEVVCCRNNHSQDQGRIEESQYLAHQLGQRRSPEGDCECLEAGFREWQWQRESVGTTGMSYR